MDRDEMARLYRAGWTPAELAFRYGVPHQTIRTALRQAGLLVICRYCRRTIKLWQNGKERELIGNHKRDCPALPDRQTLLRALASED